MGFRSNIRNHSVNDLSFFLFLQLSTMEIVSNDNFTEQNFKTICSICMKGVRLHDGSLRSFFAIYLSSATMCWKMIAHQENVPSEPHPSICCTVFLFSKFEVLKTYTWYCLESHQKRSVNGHRSRCNYCRRLRRYVLIFSHDPTVCTKIFFFLTTCC